MSLPPPPHAYNGYMLCRRMLAAVAGGGCGGWTAACTAPVLLAAPAHVRTNLLVLRHGDQDDWVSPSPPHAAEANNSDLCHLTGPNSCTRLHIAHPAALTTDIYGG